MAILRVGANTKNLIRLIMTTVISYYFPKNRATPCLDRTHG